jgi:hypothetical protein
LRKGAPSSSFVSASGGSSGRRRRPMGSCRLASRQSTGLCQAAGSRGAPCTRSWEWALTRRMARLPRPLPPASSDGSQYLPHLWGESVGSRTAGPAGRSGVRGAWCCGAFRVQIFTDPVLLRTGSILDVLCWSGRRVIPKSCGRWRRGCVLLASSGWSVKSDHSPRRRAAGYSSPRNAPASPPFCCDAGATADRQRANALCRMQRQPDGASPPCRRALCRASLELDAHDGGSSSYVAAAVSRHAGRWR